jgi:site-specific recombinase XerD
LTIVEADYKAYVDQLPTPDQRTMTKFLQELAARNLSPHTREIYMQRIRGFQKWFKKPLTTTTADDIRAYIRFMQDSGRAPYSIKISTTVLKHFFGFWMGKTDVKELKTPKGERPVPKTLDENEVLAILKAGATPYEKALVAVLYEGGLRLGELQNIKVGDLEVDQYGVKITVNGKSGERPIRLIHSAPYIQAFLEHHPFREDLKAHLFYGRVRDKTGCRMDPARAISPNGLNRILRRLARRAGVNGKRIYPHLLRHSRATVLSKNMTDRELMTVFGWKTPAMVSVYSHLSMRDVEDKLLTLAGMKSKGEEKPSPLTPKYCPRCKHLNPATSRFCSQCSMVLDLDTAMHMEEARAKADNVMSKLLEDPETQRYLAAKIKKLGIVAER